MSELYSIVNDKVVFFSEEEKQEFEYRKTWETSVNLPIQARNKRDLLLAQTDWTQAADVPQAVKDKWAPYRQALRDIPQQPGFPTEITWPESP